MKKATIWLTIVLALGLLGASRNQPMSYTYAGNPDNYPDSATLPQGSDLKNVSTVDVPFESLLDRTEFLRKRLFGGETNGYFVPLNADQISGGSPAFRLDAVTGVGYGWVQTDNSTPGELRIPIQLPGKANIIGISAWVASQNTHSDLPATMPVFSVYSEFPHKRQTSVQVQTQTDTSIDVAGYEAIHSIDLDTTGALEVDINDADKNFVLYCVFNGESGADSQPGALVLKGIEIFFAAP